MASYLYRSATDSNWDEDDDDFSVDTYQGAAAEFSAPVIEEPVPPASPAMAKYDSVHPDYWPCAASEEFKRQNSEQCRPAYVELSFNEYNYVPRMRCDYTVHWSGTKLQQGRDMKVPSLMRSSPLRESMTWDEDNEVEYIKEAGLRGVGLLDSHMLCPALSYGSHSDSEPDETCTPSDFQSLALVGEENQVEEYDPITTAIDIPTRYQEAVETDISREFVDFDHISNTLDISDILSDVQRNMLHSYIHEPSECNATYSRGDLKDDLLSAETTWEEEYDVFERMYNGQADAPTSCTPSGSPSQYNAVEEQVSDISAISLTTVDHSCVRCDSVIDLITVNTMAQHLLNIAKNAHVKPATGAPLPNETSFAVPGADFRIGNEVVHKHDKALRLIDIAKEAQATVKLNTTTVEATQTSVTDEQSPEGHDGADDKQPQREVKTSRRKPEVSTPLIGATGPSPVLKYIQDPTNTSPIWNTAAAGWFALSPVPWGRIAVAAAGALVDVAAFVARH